MNAVCVVAGSSPDIHHRDELPTNHLFPSIKKPHHECGLCGSGEQNRTADLRVMNPTL
jgi:hypothetical protein